jgi:hypothetical protein
VHLWSTAERLQVWSYAAILQFPVNDYVLPVLSIICKYGKKQPAFSGRMSPPFRFAQTPPE